MSTELRSLNVLIAALGGEGGGVLSDWLIAAATLEGLAVQSTSIPGVAQRTGATTYYLEIFPRPLAAEDAQRPILALTPTPADVDLVAATELVEAGRALQNGFITRERTTLIASTNRVFAIGEKTAMADGRFDAGRVVSAAKELARRAVLFDMAQAAQAAAAPVNALLFGAIIASGVLPISRTSAEQAIVRAAKSVETNLRGFAAGFEQTQHPSPDGVSSPAVDAAGSVETPDGVPAALPAAVREVIALGVQRLTTYQGHNYATLYLRRLGPVMLLEQRIGATDFALTGETGRHLALWMSYEDVIRVAVLKTDAGRLQRIREEVRARDGDVVRVTDFLKPGLDELCSILPPRLGRALLAWARRRGLEHRFNVGLHIRSTNVVGFLILRCLAGLRWWRPYSLRYQEEQQRIERWLRAVARAAACDLGLALEIAQCAQLVKGYGETHARGVANFECIADACFDRDLEACNRAELTGAVREARRAALADPDGIALQGRLTNHSAPAAKARSPDMATIHN